MNLFFNTFESVAILLVIGVVGFYIISRNVLPERAFSMLSPLSIDIALPCLVFVNIINNFNPRSSEGWWFLPLWWVGFSIVSGSITAILSPFFRKDIRKEFAASLFYQNGIFFPLAIMTGMYGHNSPQLVNLFLFALFYPSFFFSTCHLFWRRSGQPFRWNRVLNAVLVATVVATCIRLTSTEGVIPIFFIKALGMVGSMTVPLLMIIIGGSIYVDFKNKGRLLYGEVGKFLLFKNILFPLVALAFLSWVKPSYDIALIILIQSAVPPVTAIPIIVEREGGNRHIVNQFLFSSAIFSLISIPFAIYLFGFIY